MADPKAKKPAQTVRERSQTSQAPKIRRVQKTASSIAKPVGAAHKGVKSVLRPLSPLAKPFHTKPLQKVGHILATVLLINYLRSSWKELRKVTWPDRRATVKLTVAVFIFAIVFGTIIAVADYGLDKLFHKILLS
jgi:preprotein translocase SecE subunit